MARDWLHLTWSQKTWLERVQTVIGNVIAGLIGLVMLFGALLVLGKMMDTQDAYQAEKRRCLQQATNGLEIEQCKR